MSIDVYGHSRAPETTAPLRYGRFRNVYLYITDECQLRCRHCYMGERLDHALVMSFPVVADNMKLWRRMGGSKLSILGGEPTLHPRFVDVIALANDIGYEKVILNTNGLASARRRLRTFEPHDFAYIQVSVDGGAATSHDTIRGRGTFAQACETTRDLATRGFDTRIICTVNSANIDDCLELLPFADEVGVTLVKYHVFSGIGIGRDEDDLLISPADWIDFYRRLKQLRGRFRTRIWYQPTYGRREDLEQFGEQGFRGCIGRTLDRISVFPDGRAYVCSYLFDTELNFATMRDGRITVNRGPNEFDLFTSVLSNPACGSCKLENICVGGCPAERIVMGAPSCAIDEEILPVCRLWKAEI